MLAENWETVRLFAALGTQWRFAGMAAAPVGLDYRAVAVTAELTGIALDTDLFQRLRVMEAAALRTMLERMAR